MNHKLAIIVSLTTRVVILFGVITLIILPSLIVGKELLILGGVGAAADVSFFMGHDQLRELMNVEIAAVEESASKV